MLVPGRLADSEMGYGMLFVIGLLTSVHCIAMCGGINLSQCIPREKEQAEENGVLAAYRPAILYNAGRVTSYTLIGFILGFVGMVIGGADGGISVLFQGILKLIAGIFMVIMGVNMLGIFPWLKHFQLTVPRFLTVKINRKKAKANGPYFIGLLNGLMPCGPLQAMQLTALVSGNPFAGAFSMFMFSLGTVPLMLGLGAAVAALDRKFVHSVQSVGAVLVTVLGLAMISQGGSLSGFLLPDRLLMLILAGCVLGIIASIPVKKPLYKTAGFLAAAAILLCTHTVWGGLFGKEQTIVQAGEVSEEEIEIVDGVQVVESTLTVGRYPNITVQVGIPVKWIIDVPEGTLNGCNYKMLLKAYDIEHTFTTGENIIEFTPTEVGTVQYTCWMGMIRGNIFVTAEGTSETASGDNQSASGSASDPAQAASGGFADSLQSAEVPVPSGYVIPSEELAVAEILQDASGAEIQEVHITLTEEGFSPAVIVVRPDLQVNWYIDNKLPDAENGTELLAPYYATKLSLAAGENLLYLYAQDSFEVSTGDHAFYAYVKVVDDLEQIDEEAIRQEVDAFETLIYPAVVFESAGMSCCG